MSSTSFVRHQKQSASAAKKSSLLMLLMSSRLSSKYLDLWFVAFYAYAKAAPATPSLPANTSLPSSFSCASLSASWSILYFREKAAVRNTSTIGAAKSFIPWTYALAGCLMVQANSIRISMVYIYWLLNNSTSGCVLYTSILICLKFCVS